MRVRVLVLCLLLLAMSACIGPDSFEITPTLPAIPLEEPATATRVLPTPTLRPPATVTTTPTATITAAPTIASTSTPESVTRVELTVAAVNLRLGAGTEFAVLAVVGADEDIALLEVNLDGSWYKVRTADGIEGWVGSSVARLVEPEN